MVLFKTKTKEYFVVADRQVPSTTGTDYRLSKRKRKSWKGTLGAQLPFDRLVPSFFFEGEGSISPKNLLL